MKKLWVSFQIIEGDPNIALRAVEESRKHLEPLWGFWIPVEESGTAAIATAKFKIMVNDLIEITKEKENAE